MEINTYLLSCPERQPVMAQTLQDLAATDWCAPPRLVLDQADYARRQERQEKTALRLLQQAVDDGSQMILFLEDDLQFNRHLRQNLESWPPLRQSMKGGFFFASLYNPGISEIKRYPQLNFFIANPISVYGSQAFILSRSTAQYAIDHWDELEGMQDIKISRLAARRSSLFYHQPSLVQHVGARSIWGGSYHTARGFHPEWRSPSSTPFQESVVEDIHILDHMRLCDGWLDEDEAELLISITRRAASQTRPGSPVAFVEVSSLCGKTTVVMALTLKGLDRHDLKLTSISPHDGKVTATDGSLPQLETSFDSFNRSMQSAGVMDWIDPLVACDTQAAWDRPVGLLFIDGLHDEHSLAADFDHFAPLLLPGALVAFHDCAGHFPAVRSFVDGLLSQGGFRLFRQVKSLAVLERRP